MSSEQGPGPTPTPPKPSEIPTLDDLRQEALQPATAEAVSVVQPVTEAETIHINVETEDTPEVRQPEATDLIIELSTVRAQTQDLKRALALDYANLITQPASAPEQETAPSRIHSVHVKGYRPAQQTIETRLAQATARQETRAQAVAERPNWEDHFPKDEEPASLEAYAAWRAQFPVTIQTNIEGLRIASERQAQLLADPEVQQAWEAKGAEQQAVYEAAATVRIAERRGQEIAREVIELKSAARRSGRELTAPERQYLGNLQEAVTAMHQEVQPHLMNKEVVDELRRRDAIDDSQQLAAGLLETEGMHRVIELTIPNLAEGKPLLLFGETGGAKTALALHLSREYFNVEPEIVSGHAEVNAYQIMGKTGLKASENGTETIFNPGPMYTAMAEGKPVILDEIDAMPASFLIRLNYLLQLRPGDPVRIQEDSNEEIIIKEGFCVIATANIKSARYQREELDPALLQRFRYGAGIEHIPYPDHDVQEGKFPAENWRLAKAMLTDARGNVTLPPGVAITDLVNLLKASHTSQRMFTLPAAVAGTNFVDSQRAAQGRPALEKAVLAPREWMGILSQVKSTDGQLNLDEALTRFVASQTVASDREVLSKLLYANYLIEEAGEEDLRIPNGTLQGFRNARANA